MIKLIPYLIAFLMAYAAYNLGRAVEVDNLRNNGYTNVNVFDRSGKPIPGYVQCKCNMLGDYRKPGTSFWFQQKASGDIGDEVFEGEAGEAYRGN